VTMQREDAVVLPSAHWSMGSEPSARARFLGIWRPDPYGRFSERHFFLDTPTSRVRQGCIEGYDAVGPLLAGEAEAPLFVSLSPRIVFPGDDLRAVVICAKAHTPKPMRHTKPPAEPSDAGRAWWPLDVRSVGGQAQSSTDAEPAVAAPRHLVRRRGRRALRATFVTAASALVATAAVVLAWPTSPPSEAHHSSSSAPGHVASIAHPRPAGQPK
jgi:hypothetical protein